MINIIIESEIDDEPLKFINKNSVENSSDEEITILDKLKKISFLALADDGISTEYIASEFINFEISVTIVGEDEIKEINSQYRDKNVVTDVLSFPQYENIGEIVGVLNRSEKMEVIDYISIPLGDVIICYEKVKSQAEEFGHSLEREFLYLYTHSICHLLGYDHMNSEEKKDMRAKEEDLMKKVGVMRE